MAKGNYQFEADVHNVGINVLTIDVASLTLLSGGTLPVTPPGSSQ